MLPWFRPAIIAPESKYRRGEVMRMKRRTFLDAAAVSPVLAALAAGCASDGKGRGGAPAAARTGVGPRGDGIPGICAHRGVSKTCPENTMPAFDAAVKAGADELEFDLWLSRDGVPVVCHDPTVDRTTNGKGKLSELDWADLRWLDAGLKTGAAWRGVRLPRFEELLDSVGTSVGLNIHIKETGAGGRLVRLVGDTVRARGLLGLAYIAGDESVLKIARDCAPEVPRACLHAAQDPALQIRTAATYGCRRIQFNRKAVTVEHIRTARDAGLICNLFWSDDPADAREFVRKGIDVILTNCADRLIAAGLGRAAARSVRP